MESALCETERRSQAAGPSELEAEVEDAFGSDQGENNADVDLDSLGSNFVSLSQLDDEAAQKLFQRKADAIQRKLESKKDNSLHGIMEEIPNSGEWFSKYFWVAIEERLEKEPWSARELGSQHETPLHRAIYCHPPISSIRALVAAYPQALQLRDSSGNLPLHIVCEQKSISIFRLILHAFPGAAREKNTHGQLPLHRFATYSGGDLQMIWELLLMYAEGAVVHSEKGVNALQCLCRCERRGLVDMTERAVGKMSPLILDPTLPPWAWAYAMGVPIQRNTLHWAKAQLLLMTLHHGSVPRDIPNAEEVEQMRKFITIPNILPNGEEFRAVHAAVATGSPKVLADLTIALFPEQLKQQDSFGRLPLHWSAIVPNAGMFYCCPCGEFKPETFWYESTGRKNLPKSICNHCYCTGLKFAVTHNMDVNIAIEFENGVSWKERYYNFFSCEDILLFQRMDEPKTTFERVFDAYPEAARVRDNNGYLPLHYALLSRKKNMERCVGRLVTYYPDSLNARDPETGMFPFHKVVTCAALKPDLEKIDLVFQLLLINPACIKSCRDHLVVNKPLKS